MVESKGVPPCVLIVDDDNDIRDVLTEALTDAGYETRCAANGTLAIADMRGQRPCLVLLDLMMPPLDGWAVVAAMKADPALAGVPVCVLSAVAERAPVGASCVLRKPASLDALLAVVERYCGPACTTTT